MNTSVQKQAAKHILWRFAIILSVISGIVSTLSVLLYIHSITWTREVAPTYGLMRLNNPNILQVTLVQTPVLTTPPPKLQHPCPVGGKGTENAILTNSKPNILVGILVKNREPYTKTSAKTLNISLERYPHWKKNIYVRIYDDASNAISMDRILQQYPNVEKLIRFNEGLGWRGAAISAVYHQDCVHSNHDICIFADSDIIFSPDWIPNLVQNINKTDGQLTLYNSCSHKTIKCKDGICEKDSFGAAGAAFTRKLAAELLCNIPPVGRKNNNFDWRWGRYLRSTNRTIYALNPSMAEHIGIYHASNGVASVNEQSTNFNIFNLPQPIATLMYYHLLSRQRSSCNTSKVKPPIGWFPDPRYKTTYLEKNKNYFILS